MSKGENTTGRTIGCTRHNIEKHRVAKTQSKKGIDKHNPTKYDNFAHNAKSGYDNRTMNTKAIEFARDWPGVKHYAERSVLLMLAAVADEAGHSQHHGADIARLCQLGKRTSDGATKALERAGAIARTKIGGQPSQLTVLYPEQAADQRTADRRAAEQAKLERRQAAHQAREAEEEKQRANIKAQAAEIHAMMEADESKGWPALPRRWLKTVGQVGSVRGWERVRQVRALPADQQQAKIDWYQKDDARIRRLQALRIEREKGTR